MTGAFSRSEKILGPEGLCRLARSRVAVFGIGGVGSYAAEGLCRAGVGRFLLVDHDIISPSNINRQIHATTKTVGKEKSAVMKNRILDINPAAQVHTINEFYTPENAALFFDEPLDYIVDAVDTVSAKLSLVLEAKRRDIPIISSMGTGNKLDPTQFKVADIYKTRVCPLARVMRRELKKSGIPDLKVVYSEEMPLPSSCPADEGQDKVVPGSVSFVPSVAGLIIAGEVVRDLINQ